MKKRDIGAGLNNGDFIKEMKVKFTAAQYDALAKRAQEMNVPMAAIVRMYMIRSLDLPNVETYKKKSNTALHSDAVRGETRKPLPIKMWVTEDEEFSLRQAAIAKSTHLSSFCRDAAVAAAKLVVGNVLKRPVTTARNNAILPPEKAGQIERWAESPQRKLQIERQKRCAAQLEELRRSILNPGAVAVVGGPGPQSGEDATHGDASGSKRMPRLCEPSREAVQIEDAA